MTQRLIPSAGARRLALVLVGLMVAGCGSESAPPSPVDVAGGPPPKTERQKKAAAFERDLKSKTRRD